MNENKLNNMKQDLRSYVKVNDCDTLNEELRNNIITDMIDLVIELGKEEENNNKIKNIIKYLIEGLDELNNIL